MISKYKILIVDDEPDLREVIILVIASCLKADFIEAGSGKEAISILESSEGHFNLIVSDFNMPNGNGSTLARYLSDQKKEIPFLLLSSDDRKKHEELISGHLRSYLQKPFKNDELRRSIESLLKDNNQIHLEEQEYVPVSLSTLQRLTILMRPIYLLLGEKNILKLSIQEISLLLKLKNVLIRKILLIFMYTKMIWVRC